MDNKKSAIEKILLLGGKADPEVDNIFWLENRCLLIKDNGEIEEL